MSPFTPLFITLQRACAGRRPLLGAEISMLRVKGRGRAYHDAEESQDDWMDGRKGREPPLFVSGGSEVSRGDPEDTGWGRQGLARVCGAATGAATSISRK